MDCQILEFYSFISLFRIEVSKRLSKDIGPIFPVTKTQQLKAELPCLRIEVSKPLTSLISSSRSCSCFSSKSPIIYIFYIWNLVFWKGGIMLCVLFVELPHLYISYMELGYLEGRFKDSSKTDN